MGRRPKDWVPPTTNEGKKMEEETKTATVDTTAEVLEKAVVDLETSVLNTADPAANPDSGIPEPSTEKAGTHEPTEGSGGLGETGAVEVVKPVVILGDTPGVPAIDEDALYAFLGDSLSADPDMFAYLQVCLLDLHENGLRVLSDVVVLPALHPDLVQKSAFDPDSIGDLIGKHLNDAIALGYHRASGGFVINSEFIVTHVADVGGTRITADGISWRDVESPPAPSTVGIYFVYHMNL
jgi:hypothetical protein